MFAGDADAATKAEQIADYLGDHNNFNSHSRRIGLDDLRSVCPDVKAYDLEQTDAALHEAVMAFYWATDVTFSKTGAVKIVEHADGSAYVRISQSAMVPVLPPGAQQPVRQPNRAARRRQQQGRR